MYGQGQSGAQMRQDTGPEEFQVDFRRRATIKSELDKARVNTGLIDAVFEFTDRTFAILFSLDLECSQYNLPPKRCAWRGKMFISLHLVDSVQSDLESTHPAQKKNLK